MPNRLTAVPSRPVPRLRGPGRLLYPVADLFMVLMLSRPASGSLRQTWVTPATLGLAVAIVLVCLVAAALLFAVATAGSITAGVVLLLVASGPASVAAVGCAQRRV